jgi:transcriptional regulator with PAS, ATPase and Fis domain
LKDYEKLLIQETLKKQNGNKEKTIKLLDLSKRTFYRRCKELKIMP